MKNLLAAAVAALLCACTTVTDVVPTGRDAYMVGSRAHGGLTSDAEVKLEAIKKANAFCESQGKRAEVKSSTSTGVQLWTPQNAEVHFTCINP